MADEDKEKVECIGPSLLSVVCLFILTLVLVICTVFSVTQRKIEQEPVLPECIQRLFDGYIFDHEDLDILLDSCMLSAEGGVNAGTDSPTQDYNAFTGSLLRFTPSLGGYEFVKIKKNYVEVILKDDQGQPIYPRLGLFFTLDSKSGKLDKYTFVRLQPFSTRDKEYNKLW